MLRRHRTSRFSSHLAGKLRVAPCESAFPLRHLPASHLDAAVFCPVSVRVVTGEGHHDDFRHSAEDMVISMRLFSMCTLLNARRAHLSGFWRQRSCPSMLLGARQPPAKVVHVSWRHWFPCCRSPNKHYVVIFPARPAVTLRASIDRLRDACKSS